MHLAKDEKLMSALKSGIKSTVLDTKDAIESRNLGQSLFSYPEDSEIKRIGTAAPTDSAQ